MGCRNGVSTDEGNAVSASLSALLFTTMSMIGHPVDVHVKDGSIYSGIFHTACLNDGYGIVLKRASMIKEGQLVPNIAIGSLIATLVILSEDLVQIVAKGILLPANSIFRNTGQDDKGAISGDGTSIECLKGETMEANLSGSGDRKPGKPRLLSDTTEIHGDDSPGIHSDHEEKLELQKDQTRISEVKGQESSFDACKNSLSTVETVYMETNVGGFVDHVIKLDDPNLEELKAKPSSDILSSRACTANNAIMDANSESCPSSSFAPRKSVPPKSSACNKTIKESKLNPEAKLFSPSFLHKRSMTPPAVPTGASLTCVPEPCPVLQVATAQPEVEIGPFVPRVSTPYKFVQYDNLIAGSGVSDMLFSQHIAGNLGNRTQQSRYSSQYHLPHVGTAYVQPNSQNIMAGRSGPFVHVYPVSHDVFQNGAGFAHVPACPPLTPQIHIPKQQGSGANPALPLCMTTPFIVGGQQPFALISHAAVPQTPFPVVQSVTPPGSNSFPATKFA